MPEPLLAFSWQEQQRLIQRRAATLIALGGAGLLLFADPWVDALANVGSRVTRPRARRRDLAPAAAPPALQPRDTRAATLWYPHRALMLHAYANPNHAACSSPKWQTS